MNPGSEGDQDAATYSMVELVLSLLTGTKSDVDDTLRNNKPSFLLF